MHLKIKKIFNKTSFIFTLFILMNHLSAQEIKSCIIDADKAADLYIKLGKSLDENIDNALGDHKRQTIEEDFRYLSKIDEFQNLIADFDNSKDDSQYKEFACKFIQTFSNEDINPSINKLLELKKIICEKTEEDQTKRIPLLNGSDRLAIYLEKIVEANDDKNIDFKNLSNEINIALVKTKKAYLEQINKNGKRAQGGKINNQVTDHLNLMNFIKNQYLSQENQHCRMNTNVMEKIVNNGCFNDTQNIGSLILPKKALGLLDVASFEEKMKETKEQIVIYESCKRVTKKEDLKDLEEICLKLDQQLNVTRNDATYRYTEKNEIPVFQDGTWKWAKKRTGVELVGSGALQATTGFLPNWLGLLHSKHTINYEYMRALNIKSNQFYTQQFYENWMKNYYAYPQTFSPNQFNFGQSGLQNIGYGF